MKYGLTILFVFLFSCGFAQNAEALRQAVADFNTALIQKDSAMLKKLLHEKLKYGHSSAWIETKPEVIKNLYNGKLTYNKIEQTPADMTIEGNVASVRANADIDVVLNNKQLPFKLHIMQVWVWEKKKWQMLSRQSTKIEQ
jgi:hypothetical protein